MQSKVLFWMFLWLKRLDVTLRCYMVVTENLQILLNNLFPISKANG